MTGRLQLGSGRRAVSIAAWLGISAIISTYLFATRPAALPDGEAAGRLIPIDVVFRVLAAENDVARGLYTAEIVGAGTKAKLKFDEKWLDPGLDAGPLPALLLRETAGEIRKARSPLGLFLGSDFPIAQSNFFQGIQTERFQAVRKTGNPEFFVSPDVKLYTAMFPDYAVAPGCVTCHNEHSQSPKVDWKLNDMMGATTWSYPKDKVTLEEALQIVGIFRSAVKAAYGSYIDKATRFANPPEIGKRWPREGYFIPSVDVFVTEYVNRASASTVARLLEVAKPPRIASARDN